MESRNNQYIRQQIQLPDHEEIKEGVVLKHVEEFAAWFSAFDMWEEQVLEALSCMLPMREALQNGLPYVTCEAILHHAIELCRTWLCIHPRDAADLNISYVPQQYKHIGRSTADSSLCNLSSMVWQLKGSAVNAVLNSLCCSEDVFIEEPGDWGCEYAGIANKLMSIREAVDGAYVAVTFAKGLEQLCCEYEDKVNTELREKKGGDN